MARILFTITLLILTMVSVGNAQRQRRGTNVGGYGGNGPSNGRYDPRPNDRYGSNDRYNGDRYRPSDRYQPAPLPSDRYNEPRPGDRYRPSDRYQPAPLPSDRYNEPRPGDRYRPSDRYQPAPLPSDRYGNNRPDDRYRPGPSPNDRYRPGSDRRPGPGGGTGPVKPASCPITLHGWESDMARCMDPVTRLRPGSSMVQKCRGYKEAEPCVDGLMLCKRDNPRIDYYKSQKLETWKSMELEAEVYGVCAGLR